MDEKRNAQDENRDTAELSTEEMGYGEDAPRGGAVGRATPASGTAGSKVDAPAAARSGTTGTGMEATDVTDEGGLTDQPEAGADPSNAGEPAGKATPSSRQAPIGDADTTTPPPEE